MLSWNTLPFGIERIWYFHQDLDFILHTWTHSENRANFERTVVIFQKKNRNQYQGLTSLKIKRVTSKRKESSGRWNTHTIKSIWLLTLEIETATLPPLFRPSLLSLLVWWQRLATWQSFHRGMTKRFFLFKRGALAAAAKRGPTNIFCCWIESPSIQHPNQHQNFGFLFLKYIHSCVCVCVLYRLCGLQARMRNWYKYIYCQLFFFSFVWNLFWERAGKPNIRL